MKTTSFKSAEATSFGSVVLDNIDYDKLEQDVADALDEGFKKFPDAKKSDAVKVLKSIFNEFVDTATSTLD